MNPKTDPYSPEFDWLVFLQHAVDSHGAVNDTDYMRACQMAAEWPTCACGQLCKDLPRNERFQPHDTDLSHLGGHFYAHVGARRWREALDTFKLIEERTAYLLILQKESTPS